MHRNRFAALCGCLLAVTACSRARDVAGDDVAACARCHDAASGAHAAHLAFLAARAPGEEPCRTCHPDPRGGSTVHRDGRVEVVVGGLGAHGGAAARFDAATGRCSGVYCHGAFDGGNAGNAPAWRAGPGDAACGTCHVLPPSATHPGVGGDPTACVACHASTVDAAGRLVAAGGHLNGRIDGAHGVAWSDPSSPEFHGPAARQGLASCQGCHGAALEGLDAAVGCATCHGSGGDLDCASCHAAVTGGAPRSSHVAGAPGASGTCRVCHGAFSPSGGHFALPADAAFPDDACLGCHDGDGTTLGGRTPPSVLPGWADAAAGDFHGARAGAGSGGTLEPPYARGQEPLTCGACHDAHASANAFLLAGTVNGTRIPAGAIDRAGVGAEVLCRACHGGERHASCSPPGMTGWCHASDPEPAGSPCFFCHGHEGIVRWTSPYDSSCDACHSIYQPATESVPPVITAGPTLGAITATGATVKWQTGELATSSVEYGPGSAGHSSGSADLVSSHSVALTGLVPGTAYVWRVRTSDAFRNTTISGLRTFTTPRLDDVPPPDLGAPAIASVPVPATTTSAGLLWYPVTAPSGTAVEYEVQLAADEAFTVMASADLARIDASLATGNSGWMAGTPTTDWGQPQRAALRFDVTLTDLPQDVCSGAVPAAVYWLRVRARDANGNVSQWSQPASFTAIAWEFC